MEKNKKPLAYKMREITQKAKKDKLEKNFPYDEYEKLLIEIKEAAKKGLSSLEKQIKAENISNFPIFSTAWTQTVQKLINEKFKIYSNIGLPFDIKVYTITISWQHIY